MLDFPIPHIPPIRFVKSLPFADKKNATVEVDFKEIPTLGMIVEAAAQASAGVLDGDKEKVQMGFLITLRNIKLLNELKSSKYIFQMHLEHKVENFKTFSFSVLDNTINVAEGTITISLQNEGK